MWLSGTNKIIERGVKADKKKIKDWIHQEKNKMKKIEYMKRKIKWSYFFIKGIWKWYEEEINN